ncbi:MAG TPA: glycosyl hydrolase family 18 protein [Longimicrobium sp.]|jgi:spore germination protein YaaH|uniref:glycosyl hydrolase family 18 protein n=1 Tax=Longimicrobium sp. TaxID=2029185 RepID=UPI002ED964EE
MIQNRMRYTARLLATGLALSLGMAACSDVAGTGDEHSVDTAKAARATVPSAPLNVAATAGDARATVTWTAPTSNGGKPISSYRVTASPGGATLTVTAPATSGVVAGLINGTAYTFTVVAINSVGASPASAPSAPVTPQAAPPVPSGGKWVSGYYVGYQRSLYPPEEVDFSLMSHIIVGRILPTSNGGVLTHFDINDTEGPAMARTLSTRAHQAGKKAILMLGGEGTHAEFVSAASSSTRATFVTNLVNTMDNLGYDGIDVDWEPINDADKPALLALLQDLRARRPGMLITIPVGTVNNNFPGTYDAWYAQAAAVVDQMNVMSYAMSGNYSQWEIWHHSPLNDAATYRPTSVSSTVARYLSVGVPAAKLGIGLGFYGSCWKNVYEPRTQQTSTTAFSAGDNTMSYSNIMSLYHDPAAYRWDAAAGVPYLTFATAKGPQGCNFISYENEQSIAAKGEFARGKGLGGTIVWTIGQGHISTAPLGSRDPLLAAARQAFLPQ